MNFNVSKGGGGGAVKRGATEITPLKISINILLLFFKGESSS